MSIIRLPTKEYIYDTKVPYADIYALHRLYDKVAFGADAIISGPKGIGKTLSVLSWASTKKVPIVTYDCSEDVRRANLLGSFVLKDNNTPYVLGPLTTAYEIANEVGKCILNLEEVNALTPQMQKLLNSSTDFRKRIAVPEAATVFKLKNRAKLWVVGTMNSSTYGGVYDLNEDLKSRFRMITLKTPTRESMDRIIRTSVKSLPRKDIVDSVITLVMDTHTRIFKYQLSPRDAVQILEDTARVGIELSLWMSLGKIDEDSKSNYLHGIKSSFKEGDSILAGILKLDDRQNYQI